MHNFKKIILYKFIMCSFTPRLFKVYAFGNDHTDVFLLKLKVNG